MKVLIFFENNQLVYFTNNQRAATKEAVQIAGLSVSVDQSKADRS